jgi:murein DD-endopeptidase MepM/ murein hydrolase activator NlpD
VKVKIQIHRRHDPNRLTVLIFLFISLALFFLLSFLPKDKQNPGPPLSKQEETLAPPTISTNFHEITIQKGETLSDILLGFHLSPADVYRVHQDVQPVYNLARIKAGNRIRILPGEEGIRIIEYDISNSQYLYIEKIQDVYHAEIKNVEYEIKTKLIWGEIEDILIFAIEKQGENANLAISLAEIFAWDIDFYVDLRKGDAFKILFEKKYAGGEFVGYGNILSAEFSNMGQTYRAVRYTYPDTQESDYFDLEGNSLRKEFLKSPCNFSRISSRFSYSRLHPVRKVYRPHMGVDYVAPIGTPVQATADGTVSFAGWNGASGRMITIQHKKGYETMYLHLRGFASGIKKGKQVKGGETIGYVGASGELTGPHLDYRIKQRGTYLNPLATRFDPVEPLRPEFSADFQKMAAMYFLFLAAPPELFSGTGDSP